MGINFLADAVFSSVLKNQIVIFLLLFVSQTGFTQQGYFERGHLFRASIPAPDNPMTFLWEEVYQLICTADAGHTPLSSGAQALYFASFGKPRNRCRTDEDFVLSGKSVDQRCCPKILYEY